jgi:hypothetical protein
MWVSTDADNDAAMGLYRTTGGDRDGTSHVLFEYELGNES